MFLTTGDGIKAMPSEWKFTSEVAQQFSSHVSKSVPYYAETQKLAVGISDWFVHDGSIVYDIGCATGATLVDLVNRHSNKDVKYVGIDPSSPMLEQAGKTLEPEKDGNLVALSSAIQSQPNVFSPRPNVKLVCDDALNYGFDDNISLVYSLYTLQFIDPHKRLELCTKIHSKLAKRGAFVLVEKVLDHDPVMTDVFIHLHWAKKEEMGFNVAEIYGKAQSLRGVLIPFTVEENTELLKAAGFSRVSVFFKWCNFVAMIAVK